MTTPGRGDSATLRRLKARAAAQVLHPGPGRRGDPLLRRMYKHVYNSCRRRGLGEEDAVRVAAATVNAYRARLGVTAAEFGREAALALPDDLAWWPGRGPALSLGPPARRRRR